MELINFKFQQLDDLKLHADAAEYSVMHRGVTLRFYFKPVSSDILYVFSPGYLDRKKYVHPYYQRIKWFDVIDRCGLILTDPTLDISDYIGIAWMQGVSSNYYLECYVDLIRKIYQITNLSERKTMFFGSSAGGFSSLMFLTYFKDSFAVVNNPQTNIFNFDSKHVRKLIDTSFGGISTDIARLRYSERFCIADAYRKIKHVPRFIYVQNTADVEHYQLHYLELQKCMCDIFGGYSSYSHDESIFVLYTDFQAKHNPAVYGFMRKYFSLAENIYINS
ncbi:MAG: hypothetical protein LRY66_02405 [Saccharospirillaceae bacterium]|nr:hypothetical protein [Saccharospirillaceae bacterium]MCD8530214.1 hypothetical protein [Saccharospirillaceae bacterium]